MDGLTRPLRLINVVHIILLKPPMFWTLVIIFYLVLIVWRIWLLIIPDRIKYEHSTYSLKQKKMNDKTIRTMVVLGSGGHTTEMLKLIQHIERHVYTPMAFVMAETDKTSKEKTILEWKPTSNDSFLIIPRSREVGQSWTSTVWTTLKSLQSCLKIVYLHSPQLVLCNGPGTCIPIVAVVLLFRLLGIIRHPTKIIFCESFCRVQSLSLSGRILYYIADEFVVHWPQLQQRYPRTTHLDYIKCEPTDTTIRQLTKYATTTMFREGMIVTVAATQMSCGNREENIKKAESLIRIASSRGAQIILLQELVASFYFPIDLNNSNHFQIATTIESSPLIQGMASLAKELHVVLPICFYERYRHGYYNACAIIDADGSILGVTRKIHISDRLGYHENYYFTPSDDPIQVWETRFGCLGVAIGSDQWYPEVARALVIQGAEILLFPSAVGSQPYDVTIDVRDQWQRVMQGHAASNMVPVVASNRVGTECLNQIHVTFCGSSFISGQTGELLKIADRESEGVLVESFDLEKFRIRRASCGCLRDRRPHLYQSLLTRDGLIHK